MYVFMSMFAICMYVYISMFALLAGKWRASGQSKYLASYIGGTENDIKKFTAALNYNLHTSDVWVCQLCCFACIHP